MNNWTEVSERKLAQNFCALRETAGRATEVLAVIKANAYGHGAERCAKILTGAGANWLGVTGAGEGARVRAALAGAEAEILVMCGFLAEDVALLREHRLKPVVWTVEQVDWLEQAGWLEQADGRGGEQAPGVHLEVDTGMARQGAMPGAELEALLTRVASANLVVEGVLTHFCSAEEAQCGLTELQRRRFEAALEQVGERGMRPRWVHAGNSSTLDNPAAPAEWLRALAARHGARAMVRTGLALYGYTLPIAGEAVAQVRPLLQPVLTWKTRVLAVRELAAGETVGYNATFTADRPMRIALLPVGYADGLRRELSAVGGGGSVGSVRGEGKGNRGFPSGMTARAERQSQIPVGNDKQAGVAFGNERQPQIPVGNDNQGRVAFGDDEAGVGEGSDLSWEGGGWVMIRGRRARILGRISMNLTVVDVSAHDAAGGCGVAAGDEVVLLGPGVTADDHAALAGTIAYEILCGIHPCG